MPWKIFGPETLRLLDEVQMESPDNRIGIIDGERSDIGHSLDLARPESLLEAENIPRIEVLTAS
jgi:hypothetical protein